MTHDEAVAIIRGPRQSGAEGYLRYSAACAKVYVDHMATRGGTFTRDATPTTIDATVRDIRTNLDAVLQHFTKKAKPMKTRDAPGVPGMGNYTHPTSEQTPMGKLPQAGEVGSTLIAHLPGPVTAYFTRLKLALRYARASDAHAPAAAD